MMMQFSYAQNNYVSYLKMTFLASNVNLEEAEQVEQSQGPQDASCRPAFVYRRHTCNSQFEPFLNEEERTPSFFFLFPSGLAIWSIRLLKGWLAAAEVFDTGGVHQHKHDEGQRPHNT